MCILSSPPQLAPVPPPATVDKPVKPMVSAEDSADSAAAARTRSTKSLRIDLGSTGPSSTGLNISA